jgi:hypothetical protein
LPSDSEEMRQQNTLARPYLTACWCHNNTSRRKDPADLVRESAAYPLATSLTRFFIWTVIVARPYCDEIWFLDKNTRTTAAAFPDWEPTFCYIAFWVYPTCAEFILCFPFPPTCIVTQTICKILYIWKEKKNGIHRCNFLQLQRIKFSMRLISNSFINVH